MRNGVVYKEYVLNYQLNRYSLYCGNIKPELYSNYIFADYQVSFMNKETYNIGNIVDFIYFDSIETGIILHKSNLPNAVIEDTSNLPDFVKLYRYDIALPNRTDNGYIVREFIATDNIIKVYNKPNNYMVVKECVLDDDISTFYMKYDDNYKSEIREF